MEPLVGAVLKIIFFVSFLTLNPVVTNTSLTYTVISDNKLCCAKKKVVLVPLPVYLVKTSSSILKTFSTVHSPAEALRILSLGKVISTSEKNDLD